MPNPFVHVELQTQDPAKAKSFYKSLFKWEWQEVPAIDYTLLHVGQGTGGGLMKHPVPGAPSHWLAYVEVEDVAVTTATAKSLGAAVINEKTEVPGYGWFSIIQDPTGAVLGLWQRKAKA